MKNNGPKSTKTSKNLTSNNIGDREAEKKRWRSDAENITVWNGHYYFIHMPFLCLKNLSFSGCTNIAHVKGKLRDRRWFKWERRAYAKTTCVTAISKQWICGELGRTVTFLEYSECVKLKKKKRVPANFFPSLYQVEDRPKCVLGSEYNEPSQHATAASQCYFSLMGLCFIYCLMKTLKFKLNHWPWQRKTKQMLIWLHTNFGWFTVSLFTDLFLHLQPWD